MKRGKAAVLRGLYTNGRDKIICVNDLPPQEVATKVSLNARMRAASQLGKALQSTIGSMEPCADSQVELLLNSSGAKIKHLKNNQLEAAPGGESARGIWSVLHDHTKPQGGYFI